MSAKKPKPPVDAHGKIPDYKDRAPMESVKPKKHKKTSRGK